MVKDHPVVRLGLHMLLNAQPDIDIFAEASTGSQNTGI